MKKKKIAEFNQEALIKQREDYLKKLEADINVLILKEKKINEDISGLEKTIADAYAVKEAEMSLRNKELSDKEADANLARSRHTSILRDVIAETDKLEAEKKAEYAKIEAERNTNNLKEESNKEIAIKNQQASSENEKIKADLDDEKMMVNKSKEENESHANELLEKLRSLNFKEGELEIREEDVVKDDAKVKLADVQNKKKYENNLVWADVLSNQEKELIDFENRNNTALEALNVKESALKKQEEENAIIIMKIQSEKDRLINLEKDLRNREAKLTEKENILSSKIGG